MDQKLSQNLYKNSDLDEKIKSDCDGLYVLLWAVFSHRQTEN